MVSDCESEVGYKKPPKASQFPKGTSGNPRGRPRKDPGIAAVFRKVSKQVVQTNGKSGPQRMTKLEASVTQLVNKAATGDLKAMKAFMQMASRHPELVTDPSETLKVIFELVGPSASRSSDTAASQ
jgi:hypothetical protein